MLLFSLTLLPLAIRCFLIKKDISKTFDFVLAHLGGIAQDVFLGAELCFIFFLAMRLPGSIFFCWGIATLAHGYLLLDAFLLQCTGQRMQLAHFRYFRHMRSIFDSAKAFGLKKFVLAFALIAFYDFLLVFKGMPRQDHISFGLLITAVFCGTLSLLIARSATAYLCEKSCNALIALQIAVISRLCHKKPQKKMPLALPRSLIPGAENCEYVNKQYPLLKKTLDFKGDKLFEIPLNQEEKPHVIFLFLESFRAKDVGCLGGTRAVTPHFDALASQGVLFRQFYSNGVLTSHALLASLFSVYPFLGTTHKTCLYGERRQSADLVDYRFIGLPEMLHDVGYHTAFMDSTTQNFEKQDQFLKKHAFDTVIGRNEVDSFKRDGQNSWGGHDQFLLRHAANWLDSQDKKGSPLFLSLFTITNHHPWNVPKDYRLKSFAEIAEGPMRKYLQTMHYTDNCLGEFIATLKEKNLLHKSIVFILGDHGQPMGEHGNDSIQLKLYEENIHIPLLILAEGRLKECKVVDAVGSQIDLMPTVMDLLGLRGLNHCMGTSLVRENPGRAAIFHNPQVGFYLGCREDKYKFIQSQHVQLERELYDLSSDPKEEYNLASEFPDIVQRLEKRAEEACQFMTELFDSGKFAEGALAQQHVDARDVAIPAEVIEKLRRGGVKTLNLANNLNFTDSAVRHILKKTASLERLFLNDCHLITNEIWNVLLQDGRHLKEINLSGIQEITSPKANFSGCLGVEKLFLFDCPALCDQDLFKIASVCPGLKALGLCCQNVTDEGIAALARLCPGLQEVRLKEAHRITDKAFQSLARCSLNTLLVHGAYQISDEALQSLKGQPINILELSDVGAFTEQAFKTISELPLKRLHILGSESLSDQCFIHLKNLKLQELFLSPCLRITEEGVASIRELPLKTLSIIEANLQRKEAIKEVLRTFSEDTKIFITFN